MLFAIYKTSQKSIISVVWKKYLKSRCIKKSNVAYSTITKHVKFIVQESLKIKYLDPFLLHTQIKTESIILKKVCSLKNLCIINQQWLDLNVKCKTWRAGNKYMRRQHCDYVIQFEPQGIQSTRTNMTKDNRYDQYFKA